MNSLNRFAVVKATTPYRFSKIHGGKPEALAEAERLCRQENTKFYIIEIIGHVEIDQAPVKVISYEGI